MAEPSSGSSTVDREAAAQRRGRTIYVNVKFPDCAEALAEVQSSPTNLVKREHAP